MGRCTSARVGGGGAAAVPPSTGSGETPKGRCEGCAFLGGRLLHSPCPEAKSEGVVPCGGLWGRARGAKQSVPSAPPARSGPARRVRRSLARTRVVPSNFARPFATDGGRPAPRAPRPSRVPKAQRRLPRAPPEETFEKSTLDFRTYRGFERSAGGLWPSSGGRLAGRFLSNLDRARMGFLLSFMIFSGSQDR